jgi:hypothetical protein
MRTLAMLVLLPLSGCDLLQEAMKDPQSADSTPSQGSTPQDGDDDDDNGGGGYSCTEGRLLAGDPLYDGYDFPTEGTGIFDHPPLWYRTPVLAGDLFVTHTGMELWSFDRSDSDPVLHKIAGTEQTSQDLTTGPCDRAEFANIASLTRSPSGDLFVSDHNANAVLRVIDPFGADCRVEHYAGSTEDLEGVGGAVPNVGSADGPGDSASFGGVQRIVSDEDGQLYVYDGGNQSIRAIAPDAQRTVSTVMTGLDGNVQAMVWMDGRLYLWGNGADIYLIELDPQSGETRDVLRGDPSMFGWASGDSVFAGGMAAVDGALVVYFRGQLMQVSLEGDVRWLAGTGEYFDYTYDYDPYVPHSAEELELVFASQTTTAGATLFMTADDEGNLLVSGRNYHGYVVEVDCGG